MHSYWLLNQVGDRFTLKDFKGEPDSSVSIVSGYGLDDRAI
jgi:hypothetical protein